MPLTTRSPSRPKTGPETRVRMIRKATSTASEHGQDCERPRCVDVGEAHQQEVRGRRQEGHGRHSASGRQRALPREFQSEGRPGSRKATSTSNAISAAAAMS